MRTLVLAGVTGLASLLFLLLATGDATEPAVAGETPDSETIVGGPFEATELDVDLSTLPIAEPWQPGDPIYEAPRGDLPPGGSGGQAGAGSGSEATSPDSQLAPRTVTPPQFSTATPNFDGIAFTGSTPPDTVGDVGPNHYIQMVNSRFQIFDKLGTSLAGPTNINQPWVAAGLNNTCAQRNDGDPVVLYDHLADRWMISQFAVPNGFATPPTFQCIAISRTPNPVTGGWYLYEFQFTFGHDYPKMAVWPDAYYLSSQRGYPGGSLNAVAFDRANMLNGNPATFQAKSTGGPAITFLPGDLDGPPPPFGTPNFFARHFDGAIWGGGDRVEVWAFSVDWGNPVNTSFTLMNSLATAAFDAGFCSPGSLFDTCIPQPGAQNLDIIPNWPMWRLQYRNFGTHEAMVFNHTVDVDGSPHAGVRWYELRRTPVGAAA
ncbi:MAG: hypothetical protein U1B78_04710, partial [Dehalococcoidia bacterium]|nr:hypothetical protein [Dehalococcoidia bacterium]